METGRWTTGWIEIVNTVSKVNCSVIKDDVCVDQSLICGDDSIAYIHDGRWGADRINVELSARIS